ncbi:PIG-L family deacetylase [Mucilaginibacter conchicola]|uniref:PIG-L family deacetylase n=1 Tax=Mucilaginibacter conchicola TaxID=2303333 RepID=A0A372NSD6_9SPHI|nr:PIG-L family deacetylase [Mucilaginibacter conchicola]RFZ92176.1 PIG-L family deacetylase [Mucilaginibacter conchicola]
MKRLSSLTFSLLLICSQAFSQTAPSSDIGAIKQNLKKLNVLGSVLYIAAHPDDENTRLLGYLAQEKHYRTGYLSLTRGDGGQNLIGTEQGELLGLIRTQELLAARRVDGAEQFFSRANDFGFSKNPEETLKFWDKDKVLGDMVWVIRNFRPDVMICRFPTTGEGGHGNHTASAILAQEAFSAAADPKRYPEQLKYVGVWQAKRLLWNTFSFGSVNTTSPDQFKINVGGYNAVLGKSYGEIAAESRSNHKTQGFGSARQRGDAFEYFKTILGDAPKNDLMDGVDLSWNRIPFGTAIATKLIAINKAFNSDAPEASVKSLVDLLGDVDQTVATNKAFQTVRLTEVANSSYDYWHKQKTKELKDLIAQCAGLWFEAYAKEPVYAVGDKLNITAQLITPYELPISALKINLGDEISSTAINIKGYVLEPNQLLTRELPPIFLNKNSQPYWLESPRSLGSYSLANDTLAGNPENEDVPTAKFDFTIDGKKLTYFRKVMYKYVDPARGEIYQPLEITPPVTANLAEKLYVFNNTQPQTVQLKLKSFTNSTGSISLKQVAGWKISPAKIDFSNKHKGDEWTATFSIAPTDSKTNVAQLQADVNVNGKTFSQGILDIRYNHIPAITIFPPAEAKLVSIDLKTAGKKIGYIAGAGDLIPESLREVGYDVHLLSENEILNGDLSAYDAIVLGVRAFNVSQRIAYQQPRLMEYINNGGNLVVQYNVNNGLVTKDIGPYPFTLVNQRVTEEDAKVTVTDPQNAVLNYPNKITDADFNGWIQERGLYFADNIDSHYATPLQMNDTGMAPNKGSLLVTNYGKGRFVYTSLAFFRELPAGVPGAYRLFINLLSKPKN